MTDRKKLILDTAKLLGYKWTPYIGGYKHNLGWQVMYSPEDNYILGTYCNPQKPSDNAIRSINQDMKEHYGIEL